MSASKKTALREQGRLSIEYQFVLFAAPLNGQTNQSDAEEAEGRRFRDRRDAAAAAATATATTALPPKPAPAVITSVLLVELARVGRGAHRQDPKRQNHANTFHCLHLPPRIKNRPDA
jgi:hypothetical protein